jgi:gluconolactonase
VPITAADSIVRTRRLRYPIAAKGVRAQEVAPDLRAATTIAWAEGPTVNRSGTVYFSDVRSDRIMRMAPDGSLATFRAPANNPNGMVIDRLDRLVVCEYGDPNRALPPRITRTDLSSKLVEVLVDRIDSERLKAPNDVTMDDAGSVYFTSDERPFFLAPFPPDCIGDVPGREVWSVGVYRIDPAGSVVRILEAPQVRRPNGIGLSPDGSRLYLTENEIADGGERLLVAFDLDDEGRPGPRRILFDFSPGRSGDGMTVDIEGNIYVAAGLNARRGTNETLATRAGIHVFRPSGERLRIIPVPEDTVSNLTFGGPDMHTLYVTAGKTLYTLHNDIPGLPF